MDVAATIPVEAQLVSTGETQGFQGFLKAAGHLVGVMLVDIVKYAFPIASIVVAVDGTHMSAGDQAFLASVQMVLRAVLVIEQRWAAGGTGAGTQKLADVLEIVEQPIVMLFGQAGLLVDAVYVMNLVDGVVALLNAQPATSLKVAA